MLITILAILCQSFLLYTYLSISVSDKNVYSNIVQNVHVSTLLVRQLHAHKVHVLCKYYYVLETYLDASILQRQAKQSI